MSALDDAVQFYKEEHGGTSEFENALIAEKELAALKQRETELESALELEKRTARLEVTVIVDAEGRVILSPEMESEIAGLHEENSALKQREAALVAELLEVMFKDGWCQECGLEHTLGYMREKLSEMNLPTPEWFDRRIFCFHDYGE